MAPELIAADDLGPLTSAICAYGLSGLVLAGHFAFALARRATHARRAGMAAEAATDAAPLASGNALVAGTVETDDAEPAIVFRMDQVGEEHEMRGNFSHTWTEVSRSVTCRPFTLARANGDRVRVHPDEDVFLVDTLATASYDGHKRRVRVAKLEAGEQACVAGVLSGAEGGRAGVYRGGASLPALRRAPGERMLVSSGAHGARHTRWVQWYTRAAVALAVVLAVLHGAILSSYHLLAVAGQHVTAEVTDRWVHQSQAKGGRINHYIVEGHTDVGGARVRLWDEVTPASYRAVEQGSLTHVPFVVVPWTPALHQAGAHAALSQLAGIFSTVGTLFVLVLFWSFRAAAIPWYEQRRIKEEGTGRLTKSAFNTVVP